MDYPASFVGHSVNLVIKHFVTGCIFADKGFYRIDGLVYDFERARPPAFFAHVDDGVCVTVQASLGD